MIMGRGFLLNIINKLANHYGYHLDKLITPRGKRIITITNLRALKQLTLRETKNNHLKTGGYYNVP